MASEASLIIKSDSIEKTTSALDALIATLEKLEGVEGKIPEQQKNNDKERDKTLKTIKASNIASRKATELLELESKGLEKNSEEYAKLKAAILAKEIAAKKGISTQSREYKYLLRNITAKEKATAATKKLKGSHTSLQGVLGKFTDQLDKSTAQIQLIDGPLGGVASRVSALSRILKSGAIAWAGIGLAAGVALQQFSQGVQVAANTQVSLLQLEKQLESTGYAAGFTASQLELFAREQALATLDNTEGVLSLTKIMLQFKNVQGDTFKEGIKSAMDLAAITGKDAKTAVLSLGKALERPIENYKQLERFGVYLNAAQVKQLEATRHNNTAYEAQAMIMQKVKEISEGAAEAQASKTLAGSIDTLGQNWEELWEMLGKRALPALKEAVDNMNSLVVAVREFTETDAEKTSKDFINSLKDSKKSVEEHEAKLKDLKRELEELEEAQKKENDSLWQYAKYLSPVMVLQDKLTESTGNHIQLKNDQIKATEDHLKVLRREVNEKRELRKEELDAYKKSKDDLAMSNALTQAFIKYGDTRSEGYRKVKVALDIEKIARKANLEVGSEQYKQLVKEQEAISLNTAARVKHNTVLQKEKSLMNKQRAVQKNLDLMAATLQGVRKNSDEYITLAATIDAKNAAIQAGFAVGSEEHKRIEEQSLALAKLQIQMQKISDLKSLGLTQTGVGEIVEKGTLKALEDVAKNKINLINSLLESGTIDKDLAAKKIAEVETAMLDSIKKITIPLGITLDEFGNEALASSIQAIKIEYTDKVRSLNQAMQDGMIQDKSVFNARMLELEEEYNEKVLAKKNEELNPLGFGLTEDDKEYLLGSLEEFQITYNEKKKELQEAYQEGEITSRKLYLEKMLELDTEYANKNHDMQLAAFNKTEEGIKLIRAGALASQVGSIAKSISAAKGGNKELAKVAKAAAIFQASTSLVASLAAAAKVEPYYAKFAAYAEAAATGASIINMAKGLNEPSYAFGGVDIKGAGTARSDSIKANIANGESVITATATQRHKETLKRMNAGLPISKSNGGGISLSNSITIQGDASEQTVALIDEKLRGFEERVKQISDSSALETIQEEQSVGGLFDPI